jgi:hypothetical protein
LRTAVVVALAIGFNSNSVLNAQQKEAGMSHATGSFDVKVVPLANDKTGAAFGRMSIDKQFHGDLEATSKGEMLTAGDYQKGSAGYVAMEQVSGTLKGRSGTFFLQHNATMEQGATHLSVVVVPGSGTGQLVGLSGKMDIKITAGKHFYDFEYELPVVH